MDGLQLLTQDHDKVKNLFSQYKSGQNKAQLFEQIKQEVLIHAKVEERVVYPMLMQQPDLKPLIQDGIEEHKEVERMLNQLSGGSVDSQIGELEQKILHHVQEEEGQVFPKARQACDAGLLQRLATEIQSTKESLQSEIGGGPAAGTLPSEQPYGSSNMLPS